VGRSSEMGAGLVLLALFVAQEFRADESDRAAAVVSQRNCCRGMNIVGLLLSMVQFGALVLLAGVLSACDGACRPPSSGVMIVADVLLIP